jgi:hypothetical protein
VPVTALPQIPYRQHDGEPVGHALVIAGLLLGHDLAGGDLGGFLAIALDELGGGALDIGFVHGGVIARDGFDRSVQMTW